MNAFQATVRVLSCLFVGACLSGNVLGAEEAVDFYGVTPGVTTERELLAHDQWGAPRQRQQHPYGWTTLVYQIGLWNPIEVVIVEGRVMLVDAVPPAGAVASKLALALRLGELTRSDRLPKEAQLGTLPDPAWSIYSAGMGRALLFVEGDRQQVKRVRFFAGRSAESAKSEPKAEPITGDAKDAPDRGERGAVDGVSPERRRLMNAVIRLTAQNQFTAQPLDDQLARRTLHQFIRQFDPMKMYFTRADVDQFEQQASLAVEAQATAPNNLIRMAEQVFGRFRQRLDERLGVIDNWLAAEHDFNVQEEMLVDAGKSEYALDEDDAREKWRQRIKYELLVLKVDGEELDSARQQVKRRFHDLHRKTRALDSDSVFHVFLAALVSAHEPNSTYLSTTDYEDQQISLRGQLVGIGASLAIMDGHTTVRAIVPGGPAAQDGRLKTGDLIMAVAEGETGQFVETGGLNLSEVVRLVRGAEGSIVRLKVGVAGTPELAIINLRRQTFNVSNVVGQVLDASSLKVASPGRIGYVYMPTFYVDTAATKGGESAPRSTSRDLRAILENFRSAKVDVVVVDLRHNHGGLLNESIQVTGLFVGDGPVVQVRGADGKVTIYRAEGVRQAWDGPLVVLTSPDTAGGAEILAGAVKDYRRGLLVGDSQTAGAGNVRSFLDIGQQLFGMEQPPRLGYLLLTTQKFYRPRGEGILPQGVPADLVLPILRGTLPTMPGDPGAELPADRVTPAEIVASAAGTDAQLLARLENRSAIRRKSEPWFERPSQQDALASDQHRRAYVTLHEPSFRERHRQRLESQDSPPLPGVPQVHLDPYLREALAIAVDYARA